MNAPEHRLSTLADLLVRVEKEGHESRDMAWALRDEEKYTGASYHIGCAHTSFRIAALLKALIAKVEGDSSSNASRAAQGTESLAAPGAEPSAEGGRS